MGPRLPSPSASTGSCWPGLRDLAAAVGRSSRGRTTRTRRLRRPSVFRLDARFRPGRLCDVRKRYAHPRIRAHRTMSRPTTAWPLVHRLFEPVDIAALVYYRIAFGALMMWNLWFYSRSGLHLALLDRSDVSLLLPGFAWVQGDKPHKAGIRAPPLPPVCPARPPARRRSGTRSVRQRHEGRHYAERRTAYISSRVSRPFDGTPRSSTAKTYRPPPRPALCPARVYPPTAPP